MTDINFGDLDKLRWLIELKNSKPEEYKKFWIDVEDVMKDMFKLLVKIQEGFEPK